MFRLRRIAALLLLSLWLPATLHCDLEAAGLENWPGCHDEAAHDSSHCTTDVCHPLESSAYKPDSAPVKVPPPALGALCLCFVAICTPPPTANVEPPATPPRPPPELARTWHFIARAAPPARAPDALL